MKTPRFLAFLLASLSLMGPAATARAAWPNNPGTGNVPVSTLPTAAYYPELCPDGAGGTIIAWQDYRGGPNPDIYAQRVNAAGVPLWTANGVAVCTATDSQFGPVLASDGAGGAIIVWRDLRSAGTADLYAQRINSAGAVQWAFNGVVVCASAFDQAGTDVIPDGSGGALIAWQDLRAGTNYDIYAQRLSPAGAGLWTANGVAVCTSADQQYQPKLASDGASGMILVWEDRRSGTSFDIYTQRLTSAGAAQWTANGAAVCVFANDQGSPRAASDGAGGALFAWEDLRSGTNYDIYVQRINAAGVMQFSTGGVAACIAAEHQRDASIASDGAGGAIVAWDDFRSGTNGDVYAQHIVASGTALWTANGTALCTAAGDQLDPLALADGSGGAIVAWSDYRSLMSADVYAQRISGAGSTQWASNGVAVCSAGQSQDAPRLITDGASGAIFTWYDNRAGNIDIYCQRVERYGQLGNPEPAILDVSDVKNDQGGFVKVSWTASYLDADPTYGIAEYRVFRSVPGAFAAQAARLRGTTVESDVAVREGRLLVQPSAVNVTSWEYVGSTTAEAFAQYSRVVATTADSVGGNNPLTYFMVEARASTSISSDRWSSAADSGYSVDNLPPAAPAPFTGQYQPGATALHWNPNHEADLAGYRLYRGSSAAFVPGPANLVAALPDTGHVDPAAAPFVYKLTAVDSHGNESPVATLIPTGALGVEGAGLAALSFAAPGPNPARGPVALRWTLSRSGPVRLSVYDAAGRRVALLRDGVQAAGGHSETFALRDDAGRDLASGLYLLRLEAEGRVLTRRLAAIR